MDNLTEQCDEIEVLESIYGDIFKTETKAQSYSIQVNKEVKLYITLNENYPSNAPPSFELLAPILNSDRKKQVKDEFQDIYEKSFGGPVLFGWIERLKEIADEELQIRANRTKNKNKKSPSAQKKEIRQIPERIVSGVYHGETITDRKSVFQGHACTVKSLEDTKDVINYLLENKKIAQAKHNISAYRIVTPKGNILQDCDDDGENHAGGRVMHLLEVLDVQNVMVVVTRWYGGIQLGPDRFKHINNAARQALDQGGFLSS